MRNLNVMKLSILGMYFMASVFTSAISSAETGGSVGDNVINAEFRFIPAGSFQMGSSNGHNDERPVHGVTISRGFYMQATEITQSQWENVMGNYPSNFKGPTLPVEGVSWNEVQRFITSVNQKKGLDCGDVSTSYDFQKARNTLRYFPSILTQALANLMILKSQNLFKDNEVISIRDHLFVRNEVPYLTLVIKYFPSRKEIGFYSVDGGTLSQSSHLRKV